VISARFKMKLGIFKVTKRRESRWMIRPVNDEVEVA
jgi:hypothetical protein